MQESFWILFSWLCYSGALGLTNVGAGVKERAMSSGRAKGGGIAWMDDTCKREDRIID